ncbi:MAG: hypothetical protein AB7F41_03160 [Methylocystis sp.]|uniref:hypothetical protein n=1 Tax=Methylocystis sp. TaxID=1911079 RepID=UPI003D0ACA93
MSVAQPIFDFRAPGFAHIDAPLAKFVMILNKKQHPGERAADFMNKLSPVHSNFGFRTHFALLSSETGKKKTLASRECSKVDGQALTQVLLDAWGE